MRMQQSRIGGQYFNAARLEICVIGQQLEPVFSANVCQQGIVKIKISRLKIINGLPDVEVTDRCGVKSAYRIYTPGKKRSSLCNILKIMRFPEKLEIRISCSVLSAPFYATVPIQIFAEN
ncbi:MAG: hypothetical protein R6U13_11365 [Desulfatiglandaceae bacterium]